jgi:hypothetical protein
MFVALFSLLEGRRQWDDARVKSRKWINLSLEYSTTHLYNGLP